MWLLEVGVEHVEPPLALSTDSSLFWALGANGHEDEISTYSTTKCIHSRQSPPDCVIATPRIYTPDER